MRDETLAERDARLNAWLETVKPGDIVTVRLNSTDTLTGKVYTAPDARGTSLCVNSVYLRHGNGYPGGSYDLVDESETIYMVAYTDRTDHFLVSILDIPRPEDVNFTPISVAEMAETFPECIYFELEVVL